MTPSGIQTFTGDGTTDSFTVISDQNLEQHKIKVYISGVEQAFGVWSISGKNIVFGSAPEANTEIKVYLTTIESPISSLVETQLPQFVLEDHPGFPLFMKAYYEWAEIQGNPIDLIKRLSSLTDIDRTLDQFLVYFRKQYLPLIPDFAVADKRNLVKFSRDLYRAKGTEKSFKMLFQAMFGTDVDFYYPGRDMLRASDGKWKQDYTIKVAAKTGNPTSLLNKRIFGQTSRASAYVEKVEFKTTGDISYYELFLNRSTLDGLFVPNEVVIFEEIEATIYGCVIGINILSQGTGYKVGQTIQISGGTGAGGSGKITAIGSEGEIISVLVDDFGVGYSTSNLPFPIFPDTEGFSALGNVTIDALCKYRGAYLNSDGKVSGAKYIQDSYYYQQFSYVLGTDRSIDEYKEIIKKIIHPSGFQFFSKVKFFDIVETPPQIIDATDLSQSTYTTISWNIDTEIEGNVSLEEVLVDPYFIESEVTERAQAFTIGANYRSIEFEKFRYLPNEAYPEAAFEMSHQNEDYWKAPSPGELPLANYQLQQFESFIVDDFKNKPWKVTNIQPEPRLVTIDESLVIASPSIVSMIFTAEPLGATVIVDISTSISDALSIGTLTEQDPSIQIRSTWAASRQSIAWKSWTPTVQFAPSSYSSTTAHMVTWLDPARPDNESIGTADTQENILAYSEDFVQSSLWDRTSDPVSVTSNTTANPNGVTNGDSITISGGTSKHGIKAFGSEVVPAGVEYTMSIYVKKNNYDYLWIGDESDSSWHGVSVNLTSGAITRSTNLISSSITAVGSWYRISMTAKKVTESAVGLGVWFNDTGSNDLPPTLDATVAPYLGAAFYVWGGMAIHSPQALTTYYSTTTTPKYAGTTIDRIYDESSQVKNVRQTNNTYRIKQRWHQKNGLAVVEQTGSAFMQHESYKSIAKNKAGFTVAFVIKPQNGSDFVVLNISNNNTTLASRIKVEIVNGATWYPKVSIERSDSTTLYPTSCNETSLATNTWGVVIARINFSGNQIDCKINGVTAKTLGSAGLPVAGNTPNTDSFFNAYIFAADSTGSNAGPSGTQYGDLILYDEYIGDTGRDNLMTALMNKWNIT